MFNVKPTETVLNAKNKLFDEIKNNYKDMLFSSEQICFIFQYRILGSDERLYKLDIKPDVFVLFAVIGDERPEYRRSMRKPETRFNEWNACIDDDGKVDWNQRNYYMETLGNEQTIKVYLKIMGEKQMNVKNCTHHVVVGLQEPTRIASEILELRHLISAEYHKLICYGMSLDPNKTFQDYKMQNGDEICVYKDSPRGNLEFFEIWLTTLDKTSKPFEISQSLPLSDVINEKCLNIKTSFFWTKKQLELDIEESHTGGVNVIDIYFDGSQKFFIGHGDHYLDYMNNIDWTKREEQLEKLSRDRTIKVFLTSKTEKSYPLLVDLQENMNIALKYHQNQFRISSNCSLIKGDTVLDSQKTFEDGGIKNNDIISVTTEPIAFKAAFSSTVMIIPDKVNCKPYKVPAYLSWNEVTDILCKVFEISPGTFILYEDDNQTGPIKNDKAYSHAKYLHSTMTTWRHSIEREMKIYLSVSVSKEQLDEMKFLGKGGFGEVYLYDRNDCDRKYAFKMNKISNKDFTGSFKKEANIYNRLGCHPGIVKFICSSSADDGRQSIFMEYMSGNSLRTYLDINGKKPMHEGHIKNIANQIIEALKHLHDIPIIHRDVKADNILIDGKGRAKLSDFGLSRIVESETEIINKEYGNHRWMAPEMMLGEIYGTKVDIWSFGATMVEMVTGRIPMHTIPDVRIIKIIMNTKQIMFNYPKGSSTEIKSFTSSCLQPNASERPTAAQLLDHDFLIWPF